MVDISALFDNNIYVVTGVGLSHATAEDVTIREDGYVIAARSALDAIVLSGASTGITIEGLVAAYGAGRTGLSLTSTTSSAVIIRDYGWVRSDYGVAVSLFTATELFNDGRITATGALDAIGIRAANSQNYTIINSGTILANAFGDGILFTGNGTHNVTNHEGGFISTIRAIGENSVEVVQNGGTIAGTVDLGAGNDTYYNFFLDSFGSNKTPGRHGTVLLGAGDDSYFGGRSGEGAQDSAGSDRIFLDWGDDSFNAVGSFVGADGFDIVHGDLGMDLYRADSATSRVIINLEGAARGTAVAYRATGVDIGTDAIVGFERAWGGSGHDILHGNAWGNQLVGNSGNDGLYGYGGNDELRGKSGNDVIYGGWGRDIMSGNDDPVSGFDIDRFVYTSLADTGKTATTRDVIEAFQAGWDKIDLGAIDANGAAAGLGTFSWIAARNGSFTGVAGQLRHQWDFIAGGTIIEGDVNGDRVADFQIELDLFASLTSADFVL